MEPPRAAKPEHQVTIGRRYGKTEATKEIIAEATAKGDRFAVLGPTASKIDLTRALLPPASSDLPPLPWCARPSRPTCSLTPPLAKASAACSPSRPTRTLTKRARRWLARYGTKGRRGARPIPKKIALWLEEYGPVFGLAVSFGGTRRNP